MILHERRRKFPIPRLMVYKLANGGAMTATVRRWCLGLVALGALVVWASLPVSGQVGAKAGEWTTYGGDLAQTRYAPLDQINAGNFNKLEVAWRFKTENLGPRPEFNLESTPLVVNGRLDSTAGTRGSVIAQCGRAHV